MANALAQETSPYLRQHRDNPVDWRPWGPEALELARTQDRPLLVSIGYSACHWCHVMERESFEDEAVAELMNRHFVCVKVDREERPDIDAIYMEALQSMTGQGGWPLNVFLTPRQLPFYGGTYFPPEPRHGLPSWRQVLEAVADTWATRRAEVEESTSRIAERLTATAAITPSGQNVGPEALQDAVARLVEEADPVYGGTRGAPKFPPSCALEFLLARPGERERELALGALRGMAAGGIRDQVGGGFARYSVDATWTVPHFEKMLYDNALLARAYLHGWLVSGDTELLSVCLQTLEWSLREMRSPEGGFYSALDADSGGVEGAFYVWTLEELSAVLDEHAPAAIALFGATRQGNFEGANVLRGDGPAPAPEDLVHIRSKLLGARAQRTRPGLDDKCVTSWNALMIAALAETATALSAADPEILAAASASLIDPPDAPRLLDAARACASFVLGQMRDGEGRLLRTYGGGRARLRAYLEDHAFLAEALLSLYEATFEARWFAAARDLADTMLERFADRERGGFYSTADDHEELIVRRKELQDAPIPSGAASAALALLRLTAFTGDARYRDAAEGQLALVGELAVRHPSAFGKTLRALDLSLTGVTEVALAGEPAGDLAAVVRRRLRPNLVLAAGDAPIELLAGRDPIDGRAAAYVCRDFACRRPVADAGSLERELAASG